MTGARRMRGGGGHSRERAREAKGRGSVSEWRSEQREQQHIQLAAAQEAGRQRRGGRAAHRRGRHHTSLSLRHTLSRVTRLWRGVRIRGRNTSHTLTVLLAYLRFGELSFEDWTRAVSIALSILSFLPAFHSSNAEAALHHPSFDRLDWFASVIHLSCDQCASVRLCFHSSQLRNRGTFRGQLTDRPLNCKHELPPSPSLWQ